MVACQSRAPDSRNLQGARVKRAGMTKKITWHNARRGKSSIQNSLTSCYR
jgi:hypothetical protein